MNKLHILLALLFCAQFAICQSDDETPATPTIGLNTPFTYQMMEPSQNLRKIGVLLDAKSQDKLAPKSLYVGFSIIGLADYQTTNRDSKFSYLMRHPTSNNQIGKVSSEIVLHSAQLSLTASVNDWISAYGELLYNPEQSFGQGTITALGRNQLQLRKGIILLGNLEKLPVYAALGKIDVPFGNMNSVSPFTNSTMWHAFGALTYGGVIGFKQSGLNVSLSAIQGGSQFRAANAPVSGTAVPSKVNNYAADINYKVNVSEDVSVKLGASYLKASAYCHSWPVVHFMPCEEANPAVTAYGEIELGDRTLIKGSFAKTQNEWPGTFNPNPPLNEFPASGVSAMDIGAKYRLNTQGEFIYDVSAEFSNFISGPEGSPWRLQSQLVLGLSAQTQSASKLFFELFSTQGYVPLNFVSGGNFDDPGTTHSDRDARGLGFVLGAMLSI